MKRKGVTTDPEVVSRALREAEKQLGDAYRHAKKAETLIKLVVGNDTGELYQVSCLVPTGGLWRAREFTKRLADKLEQDGERSVV